MLKTNSSLQVLNEAAISASNFEKASDLFIKLMTKSSGKKFYKYGGKRGGPIQNKNGVGYLYFYDRVRAIRLNHDGKNFSSVTLWNAFKLGKPGDYTIDFGEMNVVQAAGALQNLIISPKLGTYKLVPEPLNEATRTTPERFMELVMKEISPQDDLKAMKWERIKEIAVKYDHLVPGLIGDAHYGKGPARRYDLSNIVGSKGADKPSPKGEAPIYFVKITSQDPISKRFLSVKDDERASSILKTIEKAVHDPSNADVEEFARDPNTLFGHLEALTRIVARGKRKSLVVMGSAGVGKTHVVMETLQDEGLREGAGYTVVKGKITTASLYQTLFMHRHGTTLVFDDSDSVWGDSDAANILKAALDSHAVRQVSWISGRTQNVGLMDGPEKEAFNANLDKKLREDPTDSKIKFPSTFNFESQIIFISNLTTAKMDAAVLNRSTKIDMTLTIDEIFHRLETLLPKLGDPDVPLDTKKEILNFIKMNTKSGKLDAPSIRTYIGAEQLATSGISSWRELMGYI